MAGQTNHLTHGLVSFDRVFKSDGSQRPDHWLLSVPLAFASQTGARALAQALHKGDVVAEVGVPGLTPRYSHTDSGQWTGA